MLRCLDYVELEDLARPLAIVAKMAGYRPLALQLLKEGLLDPRRVAGFLEGPIVKETLLDFLMIVSDLARMSKVCHFLAAMTSLECLGKMLYCGFSFVGYSN
jgi:fused-like protein